MNTLIISALKKRSILVKRYYRNPSEYNKETLINQSNECTKLIIEAKQNYIAKMSSKLDWADTTLSTYWAIINRFLNKKKIPNIPPLLVNNKLVSDFHKKAELFNRHFAEQCTLVQNTSTLPVFNFKTNNRLKSFDINENDLHLIIKNLNANKAHGWDDISIRMIQLCGKSIALPLKLLFKTILEEGTFPEDWKKSNVVPIHKKESKNLIKTIDLSIFFPYSVKFLKG